MVQPTDLCATCLHSFDDHYNVLHIGGQREWHCRGNMNHCECTGFVEAVPDLVTQASADDDAPQAEAPKDCYNCGHPLVMHAYQIGGPCRQILPGTFTRCTCTCYVAPGVPIDDTNLGLYQKYKVERIGGTPHLHDDCFFFVLDLDHDPHAIPALMAYMMACEKEYPLLAHDLRSVIDSKTRRQG